MSKWDMALGDRFPAVLAGAQAGEEHAWAALYDELSGKLARYLRARGAREPEDLVGEVFVQLARGLRRFRGNESALRGWAFLIARNRLLDELRRSSRHPVAALEAVDPDTLVATGDTEADALGRIDSARLRRHLEALTPDQRDVLLLRVVGDLSLEQVAAALGKRVGAVTQLQRRGLAALRRELAQQDREEVPA
ncbi:MAG TPA: RNA polymerase sigma factor [Acidimicrobiia bacterium]